MDDSIKIYVWGTRGTISYSRKNSMDYGCNTLCVSVECGENVFVFDAGTGIMNFAEHYYKNFKPINPAPIHLFLSHYHCDHIEGLPFFKPAYDENVEMHIYGMDVGDKSVDMVLEGIFAPPYFPISFINKEKGCTMKFSKCNKKGEWGFPGGAIVSTMEINHPGGANAFRVDCNKKSFCYVSDYEYTKEQEVGLISFIKDADFMVIDASRKPEELKPNWGHSSWEQALHITEKAMVKRVAILHYEMEKTDEDLDQLVKEINDKRIFIVKEGYTVEI